MILAPIVLFVYNRPAHTRQVIEALQKNEFARESQLFIYSDAPKNNDIFLHVAQVAQVRDYIKTINYFKQVTIIERDKNWGLANSIIDGVTTIVNNHGKVIVLEDDLVTSPYFLKFMNKALEMYRDEPKVASIHGYIYPIDGLPETFFIKGADCWGWATWKDRWAIFEPNGEKLLAELKQKKLTKEADFNCSYGYTKMLKNQIKGKNNSWAIRWYVSTFLKNMLTLYPGKSYVQNIGLDGEGTHCSATNIYDVELVKNFSLTKIETNENLIMRVKLEAYFKSTYKSLLSKVISLFKRYINA